MTTSPEQPAEVRATEAAVPDDYRTVLLNRVSWGAVLAGVVTALVVQLLLNMLGIGIGLGTLSAAGGDNPSATTLLGRGGPVVDPDRDRRLLPGRRDGRAARRQALGLDRRLARRRDLGRDHAGDRLPADDRARRRAGRRLQRARQRGLGRRPLGRLGRAGGGAGRDPFAGIERQVRAATAGNDPAALRDSVVAYVRGTVTGDQAEAQAARGRAVDALAKAANVSPEEAGKRIDEWQQQYRQTAEQAERKARDAAETARKAVSRAGLFGFVALVLGAVAAWFGGSRATPEREATLVGRLTRRF